MGKVLKFLFSRSRPPSHQVHAFHKVFLLVLVNRKNRFSLSSSILAVTHRSPQNYYFFFPFLSPALVVSIFFLSRLSASQHAFRVYTCWLASFPIKFIFNFFSFTSLEMIFYFEIIFWGFSCHLRMCGCGGDGESMGRTRAAFIKCFFLENWVNKCLWGTSCPEHPASCNLTDGKFSRALPTPPESRETCSDFHYFSDFMLMCMVRAKPKNHKHMRSIHKVPPTH